MESDAEHLAEDAGELPSAARRLVDRSLARAGDPARRAPDNELYDRGADLVEAATAIRRTAGSPEASRAVPAVLGCVEAALRELEEAAAALERSVAEVTAGTPGCVDRRADRVADRMHRGYANLREALSDAHAAAAAARSLTSRALRRPSRR